MLQYIINSVYWIRINSSVSFVLHTITTFMVCLRTIFQTRDWALPLARRGGYVPEDKINATIMWMKGYQLTIKWLPLISASCIESQRVMASSLHLGNLVDWKKATTKNNYVYPYCCHKKICRSAISQLRHTAGPLPRRGSYLPMLTKENVIKIPE